MLSLFLRNLFFTILQPGVVAGAIPFWIVRHQLSTIDVQKFQGAHYLGIAVSLVGLVIMLACIVSFAVKGRGTLSPADPTKKLVISGLYRFSRNPMYVGVTLILLGESIFFQASGLWTYTFIVFTCFNVYILFFEEPRLRRDFGTEYKLYCEQVRRWI